MNPGRLGGVPWWLTLAALAVFAVAAAVPASPLSLAAGAGRPSLRGHLSILVDETARLSLPQAVAQAQAGRFTPVARDEIAPGFLPTAAVWVHFTLERAASAPTDWWLVILHDPLDFLDLYLQAPDGSQTVRHGGRALPFATRELDWHGHAFALSLAATGEYQVYLRVATRGAFRVPLWLWQPKDFERFRVREMFVYTGVFGIMTAAILLSLFRGLRYRSAVDACYGLYILGVEMANFVLFGYFQQLGLSDDLALRVTLGWLGHMVAGIAISWFLVYFVAWPSALARRLQVLVAGLTVTYCVAVGLILALAPHLIVKSTTASSLALGVGSLAASLWAAARRWPGGLAFAGAFAPFILSVLLFQAGAFGVVELDFLSGRLLLYATTVLHAILLFGIILNRDARLRYERDRQLAHERQSLEGRVAERTRDLAEALDFNATILLNSPLPMVVYAADGRCVLANDAVAELVGTTREVVLAQNFHTLASWQASGLLADCQAALADHRPRQREVQTVTSFGKEVWIEAKILPRHLNGKDHLLIQLIDLSARKRLEDELRHIAFHDSLTLLPNRRLLLDRLEQALHASRRHHTHGAVLFIDLNRFKQLNDTHGHDAGDRLLVEVAGRLRRTLHADDTAARLGGDEFVVLLEGLSADASQAAALAMSAVEKVQAALSGDYDLGELRYQGSASVGFTLFCAEVSDPDQVLKQADAAMYAVKRSAGRLPDTQP